MRYGWPGRIVTAVVLVCFTIFSGCSQYYVASPHDLTVEDLDRFSSKVRFLRGDADAHFRMARHFQERGRHRFAVAELKKALQIDPVNALVLNALGVSLDMLGDYELAEKSYRMAIEAAPGMADAHNNLGYCYLLQYRTPEAISAFEKAIELNDQVSRYRNNLALAYVKADLPNLAFEEFKTAGGLEHARTHMAKLAPSFGVESATPLPSPFLPADILREEPGKTETVQVALEENRDNHKVFSERETTAQTLTLEPEQDRSEQKTTALESPLVPLPVHTGESFEPVRDQKNRFMKINAYEFKRKYAPSFGSADSDVVDNDRIEPASQETDLPEPAKPVESLFASLDLNQASVSDHTDTYKTQQSDKTESSVAARKREIRDRKTADKKLLVAESLSNFLGIEISNGNGVNGMARRVGNYLKNNGLSVIRLTNAEHFGHSETVVFYTAGLFQEAYRVAMELPGYQEMREVDGFDRSNVGIRVLIGKDIIGSRRLFD